MANLRWLSSRQALQDLVTLKEHVVAQYGLPSDTKWVSFGGSYSGVHLLAPSFSSSCPLPPPACLQVLCLRGCE